MSKKAVVFGATLAAPMVAASGAEAYVPDEAGAPEPTKHFTSGGRSRAPGRAGAGAAGRAGAPARAGAGAHA